MSSRYPSPLSSGYGYTDAARASPNPRIEHPRPKRPVVQAIQRLQEACRTPRPPSSSPTPAYIPAPTPALAPAFAHHTSGLQSDADLPFDAAAMDDQEFFRAYLEFLGTPPSALTFTPPPPMDDQEAWERWLRSVFEIPEEGLDVGNSNEEALAELQRAMPPTPDTWGGLGYTYAAASPSATGVAPRVGSAAPHAPSPLSRTLSRPSFSGHYGAPSPASTIRSFGGGRESAYDGDEEDPDYDSSRPGTRSTFAAPTPAPRAGYTPAPGLGGRMPTPAATPVGAPSPHYHTAPPRTVLFDSDGEFKMPPHFDARLYPELVSKSSSLAGAVSGLLMLSQSASSSGR